MALSVVAASCAPPASRPAEGAVGEQVRSALASGSEDFQHADWDRLLAQGTRDGLVDYRYFQQHRQELDRYLQQVAEVDLAALTRGHLMALLMNAYNALTIRSILDHPHVESIRQIDGVWDALTHRVGGFELTLDAIEHNLLRPYFRDPRVHFGVNCASLSCAPLPPWAFDGERIEEQLEQLTRAFLRDPRNVRVEADRLLVSSYFSWYGEDFVSDGWKPRAETIPGFIARYAGDEVAALIASREGEPEMDFLGYDWSLNALVPPDPSLEPEN